MNNTLNLNFKDLCFKTQLVRQGGKKNSATANVTIRNAKKRCMVVKGRQ